MNKKTKIVLCVLIALIILLVVLILSKFRTYKITFDTDGGSYIAEQVVKKGEYVTKPVDPTKKGYKFDYWEYNHYKYNFLSKVNGNITLKAVWQVAGEIFKLTFEVDGITKTIEVQENEKVDLNELNSLEKEGYIIKWYQDNKEIDLEKELIKSNMELKGKYVEAKTYEVKFDSDGGTKVDTQKVIENKLAKEPTEPTKDGYIFDAWYLGNIKYEFTEKVTKNITLKAKWLEDANVKRYTVKFDTDGGNKINNQTIIEGKKVTKPNNPTKKGYVFKEWQLNGNAYNFNSAVTSNFTLKAVWEKEKTKYTVTFNTDGGTNINNQSVVEGSRATKPTDPTKDGYIFKEWQLNGEKYSFDVPVAKDITLKAIWQETTKYSVTFNTDGGSTIASQTIEVGGKATKPADPTKPGYIFKEWQLNGSAYNFNSTVNSNITLTAVWQKAETYTVTFNTDGGSNVASQTVVAGSKASKPTNPTKQGYNFKEWQLNGSAYDFNTAISGNITLKAIWTQKSYEVKVSLVSPGDTYSPDRVLSVYEDGTKINVSLIKYTDGYELCKGSNPTVNINDLDGVSSLIVVLTDGTSVTARVI